MLSIYDTTPCTSRIHYAFSISGTTETIMISNPKKTAGHLSDDPAYFRLQFEVTFDVGNITLLPYVTYTWASVHTVDMLHGYFTDTCI